MAYYEMSSRIFKPILIIEALILIFAFSMAYAENIDPDSDGSQYAWCENVGWLNLEPEGDGGSGVDVDEFELTGYIWGENIGWISLSCTNTSSCGTADFGVENDGNGNLSGYAWSENEGWINFAPTGGGVYIDACGDFNGLAWGENIGWISFRSDGDFPFRVTASWVSPIDDIPPVTQPDSPVEDWYTDDVSISLFATDCGSGVKGLHYFLGGSEVIIPGATAAVNITDEGVHTLSFFSEDIDENVEPETEVIVRIDKTSPIITLTTPPDSGAYIINSEVIADFNVTDGSGSGISSTTATVDNGNPVDTSSAGDHLFTVTADDLAGNSGFVTHTYTVSYAGNIDPNNSGLQYAYGENVGWINFQPSYGPGVTVTGSAVAGMAWAENIGWINLSPIYGGVTNDGNGNLSGYAWSENEGWISFSCENTGSCGTASYGVTVDPDTGVFSGKAWGENIAWISFDYSGSETHGVKTSWAGSDLPTTPDCFISTLW